MPDEFVNRIRDNLKELFLEYEANELDVAKYHNVDELRILFNESRAKSEQIKHRQLSGTETDNQARAEQIKAYLIAVWLISYGDIRPIDYVLELLSTLPFNLRYPCRIFNTLLPLSKKLFFNSEDEISFLQQWLSQHKMNLEWDIVTETYIIKN